MKDLEHVRLIMAGERAATFNEIELARAVIELKREVERLGLQVAGSVKWHTADL